MLFLLYLPAFAVALVEMAKALGPVPFPDSVTFAGRERASLSVEIIASVTYDPWGL